MPSKTYSLKKGGIKFIISVLTIVGAGLAFTAFADMTLWGILEKYLKPILKGLTVGGSITLILNYLKVKFSK